MTTTGFPRPGRAWLVRRLLPRLVVTVGLPLIVYGVLRPHVHPDATALLIAAAIPTTWALGRLAVTRRLDALDLWSVAGFGLGALSLWLSGGSELVFKLREPALTGAVGLVCLGSVVIGRPLLAVALRLLARRYPALRTATHSPVSRRRATVITVIIGATLVVHAAALVVLAIALPTMAFLAMSHPVGLPILIAGGVTLLWYRRRADSPAIGAPTLPQPGRDLAASHDQHLQDSEDPQ